MTRIQQALVAMILLAGGQIAAADDLHIERLTWAGIKLVAGDTTVFVDAIGTDLWDGHPPGGLVALEADTSRRYALITHAHNDHFDATSLKAVLGDNGYVICHESVATYVASRGLRVIPAKTWEPLRRGGFVFTAVPAEDGFGAEQVSWIVSRGDRKFLHAGDTLWHGKWSLIGQQFGPFDAVFLPINAARVGPDPKPETPGVMGPEQAVDAAILLGAMRIVPIHFGGHQPPGYLEPEQVLATFLATAKRRNMVATRLLPGERLEL
jgi:L-ascorbate metabolism protein UlaG (beta-lactamase superfamily)